MMREDAGLHALLLGLVTVLFVLQPLAGLGWAPCWLPLAMTLATLAAGVLALAEVTRLAGQRPAAPPGAGAGPGDGERIKGAAALYLLVALCFATAL
jgi:hypothetical protein